MTAAILRAYRRQQRPWSELNRDARITRLSSAIIGMGTRYACSMSDEVAAVWRRNALRQPDLDIERLRRASRRRQEALHRLVYALEDLARQEVTTR